MARTRTSDDLALIRQGVADALMAAAEERDRDEDEILSPATVDGIGYGGAYEDQAHALFITTRDGRRWRVTVTEEV